MVDIVIPVDNDEAGLAASVERSHAFLPDQFPFAWSIDGTWAIATDLV
jgi:hypothetical protein